MSTWIGLEVGCHDPVWEKVNQLGEDADVPHITLAYLGKPRLTEMRHRRLIDVVTRWARSSIFPLYYEVQVLGFDMFGKGAVTVLKVEDTSATSLSLIRQQPALTKALEECLFDVDRTYAFVPHVTVGHGAYVHSVADVAGLRLDVRSLFVSHNGRITYITRRIQ